MINISVFLFGKPGCMLDLEKASPEDFEELGKDLNFWLKRVKEIITKLESNGWDRSAGLYDLFYYKEITLEEAKKELKDLKISLKEIDLHEWEEE